MIIPRTYCRMALLSTVLLFAGCQHVVTPQGDFVQTNQQAEQKPLSLQFNQGRISGFTGCNRAMGSFTVDKGDLVVSQLASTMMACEETAMQREQAFSNFLQSKPALSIDSNVLILSKDDIEYRFSLQP